MPEKPQPEATAPGGDGSLVHVRVDVVVATNGPPNGGPPTIEAEAHTVPSDGRPLLSIPVFASANGPAKDALAAAIRTAFPRRSKLKPGNAEEITAVTAKLNEGGSTFSDADVAAAVERHGLYQKKKARKPTPAPTADAERTDPPPPPPPLPVDGGNGGTDDRRGPDVLFIGPTDEDREHPVVPPPIPPTASVPPTGSTSNAMAYFMCAVCAVVILMIVITSSIERRTARILQAAKAGKVALLYSGNATDGADDQLPALMLFVLDEHPEFQRGNVTTVAPSWVDDWLKLRDKFGKDRSPRPPPEAIDALRGERLKAAGIFSTESGKELFAANGRVTAEMWQQSSGLLKAKFTQLQSK